MIDIGAQICRQRDENGKHVLSIVEDKVVQDIDGTEGTGVSHGPSGYLSACKLTATSRSGLPKKRSVYTYLLHRCQMRITYA